MLVILIVVSVILMTFVYAGLSAAPWAPTRRFDVDRFLKMVGDVKGKKIYDLGCGDGRMVCGVAKKGASAVGMEISIIQYLVSLVRARRERVQKNCSIKFSNFWRADLGDADVVYFFLMPKIYEKLRKKFEKELKKGTIVVAYVWPIKGWTPKKVDECEARPNIYMYEV